MSCSRLLAFALARNLILAFELSVNFYEISIIVSGLVPQLFVRNSVCRVVVTLPLMLPINLSLNGLGFTSSTIHFVVASVFLVVDGFVSLAACSCCCFVVATSTPAAMCPILHSSICRLPSPGSAMLASKYILANVTPCESARKFCCAGELVYTV